MDDLVEAVIAEAEHILEALEDVPGWVEDAGVDMPSSRKLEDAVGAYRDAQKAARRASRGIPESMPALIAALIEDCDSSRYISADRTGGSWVLSDGVCMLRLRDDVCDFSVGASLKSRFPVLTDDPATRFLKVALPVADAPKHTVTLEQLEAWASAATVHDTTVTAPYGGSKSLCARIGGTPVDPTRFAPWGTDVARIVGGDIYVKFNRDSIVTAIGGDGWETLVMGMRVEESFVAPELLKENANG